MRDEGSPSKQSGIEALDFIGVSRRVLHVASRGAGRIEFLREVSRLLLDFSACDALMLVTDLDDGASRYRWAATRVPEELFRFEPRFESPRASRFQPADGTVVLPPCSTQPSSWLDELIASVLDGNVGPKSRCITPRGSYWTGDAASDLVLAAATTVLPEAAPLDVRSIAVIPFDVTPSIPGVLALLSGRNHLFSEQRLEFYEALAQTLGLAMDDRRSQHALRERVKELSCLYAIAQVLESAEGTVAGTLDAIVRLLPSAWQYPDVLVARIRIDQMESATGEMDRAVYRQEAPVVVDGIHRGSVEVGYVEDRPEFVEGVFLKEEEHLITAIAREVFLFVQRRDAQVEKLSLAEQVRQADRLATIGRLAAGMAHEINEPLGAILGFAQLARKFSGVPDPVARDLQKIVQAALHAREFVRKLMLFARQSPPSRTSVRLNEIVEESLVLLGSRLKESGVTVVRDLDQSGCTLSADAVQLHQLLVNLCVNAIQAMPPGGTLTVRTQRVEDSVRVTVEDTGSGISPDIAGRIFEPFFTTKTAEQGTGLGLSVVHGIVTSHGGTIRFGSRPGGGTKFEISLPTSAVAAPGLEACDA
ncbi:MAG: hypothetical protein IT449_08590 [Phycisphaerales bacterium]|nr:hypothetical protein [Phycisphaerales bacterium]